MFNNSLAISVSDEEPEELAGKTRLRARRKQKKPAFRSNEEQIRRLVRKLVKWWPMLILVVFVLFLFQASRIGRKSSEGIRVRVPKISERKSPANLDRLDPTS